jgi:aquaglyceroporin related protein
MKNISPPSSFSHDERPHHFEKGSAQDLTLALSNMQTLTPMDSSAYAEHGASIDHHIPQEEVTQSKPDLLWSRIRHTLREPFSEFFGVFICE